MNGGSASRIIERLSALIVCDDEYGLLVAFHRDRLPYKCAHLKGNDWRLDAGIQRLNGSFSSRIFIEFIEV